MEAAIAVGVNLIVVVFAAGGCYQSMKTMKSDIGQIKKKLFNGMSESLVRLEQKVDDLPCKNGGVVCK